MKRLMDLNAFQQLTPESRARAIIAIEKNLRDHNDETQAALEYVLQGLGAEGYEFT